MAGAQRDWPQFMLRVSPEMKSWIEEQAERNFASQNSEILRCIQERMDRTAALEARRTAAAGKGVEARVPAVARKKTALASGSLNTQG